MSPSCPAARPATSRRAAWLVAALALVLPARAQDTAGDKKTEEPKAAAEAQPEAKPEAPAAKSNGLKGIRKGTQRISLFAGFRIGQTAKGLDLITPPLNTEPVNIRVEMDDSAFGGLSYSYQWHEKWAVEFGWEQANTSLTNPVTFTRAEVEAIVAQSTVSAVNQASLVDRLESHAGPYDITVSTFDVGITRIFSPKSRWVTEAGAGLGWGWGSLDQSPAIYEQLVHSRVEPGSSDLYVIANEEVDGTGGQDCPATDDPCVKLTDGSGMTFNANGGVSYAFTDKVHLRMGLRVRYMQRVVDPGDGMLIVDGQLGLSFLWGGK